MAKVFSMSMSIPGVEIWVNYNAANQRITTVEWTLPVSGVVARVKLWNNDVQFYDRTVAGPASGTENVPGNHQLVEKIGPNGQPYFWLPDYLKYQINIETIS